MRTPGRTPPDPNVSTGDPATRKIIGEYRDGVWTTRDLEGEVYCAPVVAAGWQSFSFQLSGAKIPHAYRLEYVTVSDGVAIEGDKFTITVTVINKNFRTLPRTCSVAVVLMQGPTPPSR